MFRSNHIYKDINHRCLFLTRFDILFSWKINVHYRIEVKKKTLLAFSVIVVNDM